MKNPVKPFKIGLLTQNIPLVSGFWKKQRKTLETLFRANRLLSFRFLKNDQNLENNLYRIFEFQ